jgi:hypothetical protein
MKIDKVMTGKRDGEEGVWRASPVFGRKREADRAACSNFGMERRISWPFPRTAKAGGSIWGRYLQ